MYQEAVKKFGKGFRGFFPLKQARKLQATLVRNSAQRLSDSLTGVKCRATSVAKKVLQYVHFLARLALENEDNIMICTLFNFFALRHF